VEPSHRRRIPKSAAYAILHFFLAGANQLLWYYADLEKQQCMMEQKGIKNKPLLTGNFTYGTDGVIRHDINHCLAWRRFAK